MAFRTLEGAQRLTVRWQRASAKVLDGTRL